MSSLWVAGPNSGAAINFFTLAADLMHSLLLSKYRISLFSENNIENTNQIATKRRKTTYLMVFIKIQCKVSERMKIFSISATEKN